MKASKLIVKRGSSASRILDCGYTFTKEHLLNDSREAEAIEHGIKLLARCHPEFVHTPITSEISVGIPGKPYGVKYVYQQSRIEPWIKESWITSAHLYALGELILLMQKTMIDSGLSFADARPSNFALVNYPGKLVDLASIKPCSKASLASFSADFTRYFIKPLLAEKMMNIPVSLYFEGGLDGHDIRFSPWSGLIASPKICLNFIQDNIKRGLSEVISASSPEFIRFLCVEFTLSSQQAHSEALRYARQSLRSNIDLFRGLRPPGKKSSHWLAYASFHDKEYMSRKKREIQAFASKAVLGTRVVDLGSNTTSLDIMDITVRIDRDYITANKLREQCDNVHIVLNLDIAKALCSGSQDQFLALNCQGTARAAVVTGLIHHLVIDEGLHPESVYQAFSNLYDYLLLEFPTVDDPMVQLLAKKKGEPLGWSWEDHEQHIISSGFFVSDFRHISPTRLVAVLSK